MNAPEGRAKSTRIFWEVTEADFVVHINLKGTFFLTQDFVNHLRDTKRPGKIINISSVHEELPFPHFSTYCASKGALKMLCRDLAIELAPLGITINNIAPGGAIETPINTKLLSGPDLMKALLANIPLNRLGKGGDVHSQNRARVRQARHEDFAGVRRHTSESGWLKHSRLSNTK